MPASTSWPLRMPSASGSPTGRTPQERSRVPQHRSGETDSSVSPTERRPRPHAGLGQPLGVEDDLALGPQVLAGLRDGRDGPSQVTSMATGSSVGSATTRSLRRGSRTSTVNGPTEARPGRPAGPRTGRVLAVAPPDVDEGVDHAQVGVLAEARRWRTSRRRTDAG